MLRSRALGVHADVFSVAPCSSVAMAGRRRAYADAEVDDSDMSEVRAAEHVRSPNVRLCLRRRGRP